jgi:uncharacterized membrane protein YjgN (DUF898 family)
MEHDGGGLRQADPKVAARSELIQGAGWSALGAAALIGSLRMDRLESQHINPYTVPGLLPGLLGITMMLLGILLVLRSWRRGALEARHSGFRFNAAEARRIALVLVLCIGFGVGLVGHGLPFWLASAIFVSIAIVALQRPSGPDARSRFSMRDAVVAIVIGLCAGGAITLVFERIFLVRLP